MIEEAEEAGMLRKGQPIVELTSGNTGTGLAIVCAVKGYRFIACMSNRFAVPVSTGRAGTTASSTISFFWPVETSVMFEYLVRCAAEPAIV